MYGVGKRELDNRPAAPGQKKKKEYGKVAPPASKREYETDNNSHGGPGREIKTTKVGLKHVRKKQIREERRLRARTGRWSNIARSHPTRREGPKWQLTNGLGKLDQKKSVLHT